MTEPNSSFFSDRGGSGGVGVGGGGMYGNNNFYGGGEGSMEGLHNMADGGGGMSPIGGGGGGGGTAGFGGGPNMSQQMGMSQFSTLFEKYVSQPNEKERVKDFRKFMVERKLTNFATRLYQFCYECFKKGESHENMVQEFCNTYPGESDAEIDSMIKSRVSYREKNIKMSQDINKLEITLKICEKCYNGKHPLATFKDLGKILGASELPTAEDLELEDDESGSTRDIGAEAFTLRKAELVALMTSMEYTQFRSPNVMLCAILHGILHSKKDGAGGE